MAGLVPSAAQAQSVEPPDESRFQKVLLEDSITNQPMRVKVAPDGRVIFIERQGAVRVWDPDTQSTETAATVPTQAVGETGLTGLALAPDFEETGHLYLYRALPGFNQSASPNFRRQRISRFTLSGDNVLDLNSEVEIMDTVNRGGGGHSGGDMVMTPDGLLFITTGDNTGCCASAGYAPHDERPGQASNDAQRTSGNTNDLNGKLLRIRPLPGGGYTIPDGNLFTGDEDGGGKTRPEIYAMGFRNLFTVGGYDPENDAVWIADYGPDAALDDPVRGPKGYVRGMLVTESANYGWPYCTANNQPYGYWDYANNVSRGFFDCDNPTNLSPNNTGLVNLPPIKPANVYYSYGAQEPWPMLYGGGLHAFDRYEYDPDNPSPTKFPEWFDGRYLFGEFTSNFMGSLRFGEDMSTPEDVRLHWSGMSFASPFDAEFGPDGSLYVLEFGDNVFSGARRGPGLYRIDYVEGNRVPLVSATVSPDSGQAPFRATFDASETSDPDGDELSFSWDFDGDGEPDATGPTVTRRFTENGVYSPRVTVTDEHGASAIANLEVTVGNTRPMVEFVTPADGGFAEFSDDIAYEIRVTDPEDGEIDCTQVEVTYLLGHDDHAHPTETTNPGSDCRGIVEPVRDGSHGGSAYVYHVVAASYTDSGGADNTPALEGAGSVILHPRAYQAQHSQGDFGVTRARSVYNMGVSGSWLRFPHINVANVDRINVEISGQVGATGGNWTLRAGSPTGPVVSRLENLPDTGTEFWVFGAQFQWLTAVIRDPGGVNDLYVVVDYPDGVPAGRITLRNFRFGGCPSSDQRERVIVGGVDSGVANHVLDDGCTINDLIVDHEHQPWESTGSFLRHVLDVTSQLVDSGVISSRERGEILRAAGQTA
jgi:glucose/arabinose dehydrogenase